MSRNKRKGQRAPKLVEILFNGEWVRATLVGDVPAGRKYRFESDDTSCVIPLKEVPDRVRRIAGGSGAAALGTDHGKAGPAAADDTASETCVICQEELSPLDDDRAQLPCLHHFHKECYDSYKAHQIAEMRPTRQGLMQGLDVECPLCRSVSRQTRPGDAGAFFSL